MKRYMKLILLLLEYAEQQTTRRFSPPELDEYTEEQVHYHVGLCGEAGYLHIEKATTTGSLVKPRYTIDSLTWEGHEALERLRKQG